MKLMIERSALLKSLSHIQSVVERRSTVPVLANVRLEAANGSLGLNATDMDLEVIESTPAEVESDGCTTAPAHTLFDIVRKMPEGSQIRIEYQNETSQITLRAGRSKFSLACLPGTDFPVMSGGVMKHEFAVASSDLRGVIDRTRFAISTEETRFYLNGIYLHPGRSEGVDVLRAVATDGHRLARVDVPLPEGAAGMPGIIIPRKTIAELRKLIDEMTGDVQVSLSEFMVRFVCGDVILTSKLIDGVFPDYERVIPEDNDKILEINCKEFAQAVDRVSAISNEKSRAIKVAVSSGGVMLSASSPDAGSAMEELEAIYDAAPMEIGFNSRYLMDILTQIAGDAVRFVMADSGAPTIVQEVADASAVYVLMPMRV